MPLTGRLTCMLCSRWRASSRCGRHIARGVVSHPAQITFLPEVTCDQAYTIVRLHYIQDLMDGHELARQVYRRAAMEAAQVCASTRSLV